MLTFVGPKGFPVSLIFVAAGVAAGCGDTFDLDSASVTHRVDGVAVPPATDTAVPIDSDESLDSGALADSSQATDAGTDSDVGTDGDVGATTPGDTASGCALGRLCNPIPVLAFPYTDTRDTRTAPDSVLNGYSCAPDTNEGGGEFAYRVEVTSLGVLTAMVDDVSGDAFDVDVHLLDSADVSSCLQRDNRSITWVVRPGTYWLVVDTWVSGAGEARPGPYTLTVEHADFGAGPCAMETRDQVMFWSDCAPGIDCFQGADGNGVARGVLRTPAWGPVVREAHLVTVDEGFGGNGWPTAARDEIERHYALSEGVSGFEVTRSEPWAPFGEGGSQWGQGAVGSKIPVAAEAWYINMFWRSRPARGTRVLVYNPETGRAVVGAGGYETGPGANTSIGGAVEEVQRYLGTGHRDPLVMGFLVDQTLPYGPITCGVAP